MSTKNSELEIFTFDQIKDEFTGKIGTEKRTQYEQELELEVLAEMTLQRPGEKYPDSGESKERENT